MDYDYLKLKNYDYRIDSEVGSQNMYVLSFNERQHIKVSEVAKIIMDCFNGNKTINQIQSELSNKNINCGYDDLIKFIDDILVKNFILEGMEDNIKRKNNSYMWCHFPITDSRKLLWLFKLLEVFYFKYVYTIVLSLIILCGGFSIYNILNSGIQLKGINSLAIILLAFLSLVFHEFGHVTAAYKQKIHVGEIGVGVYLFSLVFYVDMSNTWRLDSKSRVFVDAGGMYFQLITIIPLTIIGWAIGDNFIYVINIYIIFLTIINLIPFIKLDGYWIVCDYLGLDNLSNNAFGIVANTMKGILENDKDKNLLNAKSKERRKVYIISAFIYTLATFLMLIVGIILAIKLLLNFNIVMNSVFEVFKEIKTKDIKSALVMLNQTFILILPLLCLGYMVIQIVVNIIKKITSVQ